MLTFEDVTNRYIPKIAGYVSWRYRHFGIEYDDVVQELHLWLYETRNERGDDIVPGIDKVNRWLAAEPQRTTRIYRSLLDVGILSGEKAKASHAGYDVDDITWYTPSMITALLPLALDEQYEGGLDQQKAPGGQHGRKTAKESGDLLAMVVDVRKALSSTGSWQWFVEHDDSDPAWRDQVLNLINYLGGERPFTGRRRVMSNAQAVAVTRDQDG